MRESSAMPMIAMANPPPMSDRVDCTVPSSSWKPTTTRTPPTSISSVPMTGAFQPRPAWAGFERSASKRRQARCADRRHHGRDERHEHAHRVGHDHRARLQRECRLRDAPCEPVDQLAQDRGDAVPSEDAQRRCDDAGDQSLEHDDAEHLATRRADRAQQPDLARALSDQDREGVEDRERADEDRDRRESEDHVLEDPEEALVDRLGLLVGELLARDRVVLRTDHARHVALERLLRDPVLGGDLDRREAVTHVEELLGLLRLEHRDRRAVEVVGLAELDDARDLEVLDRATALGRDADLVPDLELAAVHEGRVEQHLAALGLLALDDPQRPDVARALDPVGAEGRRATGADRLALLVEHGGADLEDAARDLGDPVDVLDLVDHGLRHADAREVDADRAGSGRRLLLDEVLVLVRLDVDVDAPRDACVKRSSKDDRMESVRKNAPETNPTPSTTATLVRSRRSLRARTPLIATRSMAQAPPLVRVERERIFSKTASADGRSSESTMRPSKRNSTRSATLAEFGSWVTMTIVWP